MTTSPSTSRCLQIGVMGSCADLHPGAQVTAQDIATQGRIRTARTLGVGR